MGKWKIQSLLKISQHLNDFFINENEINLNLDIRHEESGIDLLDFGVNIKSLNEKEENSLKNYSMSFDIDFELSQCPEKNDLQQLLKKYSENDLKGIAFESNIEIDNISHVETLWVNYPKLNVIQIEKIILFIVRYFFPTLPISVFWIDIEDNSWNDMGDLFF